MSANKWGFYRDINTGRTGAYPCDVARLFDNLVPADHEDGCVDCGIKPEPEPKPEPKIDVTPLAVRPKVADKEKDK